MDGSSTGNVIVSAIGVVNIVFIVYAVKVVIEPMKQLVNMIRLDVAELYVSRNSHQDRLTAIETIHRVKRCDNSIEARRER